MKNSVKPPRTKGRARPAGVEDTAGRPSGKADDKARSPEATDNEETESGRPSREEVISTWRKPVTNQDEQEKITNDGGDDLPVQDT